MPGPKITSLFRKQKKMGGEAKISQVFTLYPFSPPLQEKAKEIKTIDMIAFDLGL